MVSDVNVGTYISGGYDSSSIASIASNSKHNKLIGFTGKFSRSGKLLTRVNTSLVAEQSNFELKTIDISSNDFITNINKVIYHLDQPVAGPGSFSQYMVSKLASKHRKVVLGGQGGDEIFGGYTRYLIAYFEQCIKAAIDGTSDNGNFIVTYESIIQTLQALLTISLIKQFWKDFWFNGWRYFQLINRAKSQWNFWDKLEPYSSKNIYGNF